MEKFTNDDIVQRLLEYLGSSESYVLTTTKKGELVWDMFLTDFLGKREDVLQQRTMHYVNTLSMRPHKIILLAKEATQQYAIVLRGGSGEDGRMMQERIMYGTIDAEILKKRKTPNFGTVLHLALIADPIPLMPCIVVKTKSWSEVYMLALKLKSLPRIETDIDTCRRLNAIIEMKDRVESAVLPFTFLGMFVDAGKTGRSAALSLRETWNRRISENMVYIDTNGKEYAFFEEKLDKKYRYILKMVSYGLPSITDDIRRGLAGGNHYVDIRKVERPPPDVLFYHIGGFEERTVDSYYDSINFDENTVNWITWSPFEESITPEYTLRSDMWTMAATFIELVYGEKLFRFDKVIYGGEYVGNFQRIMNVVRDKLKERPKDFPTLFETYFPNAETTTKIINYMWNIATMLGTDNMMRSMFKDNECPIFETPMTSPFYQVLIYSMRYEIHELLKKKKDHKPLSEGYIATVVRPKIQDVLGDGYKFLMEFLVPAPSIGYLHRHLSRSPYFNPMHESGKAYVETLKTRHGDDWKLKENVFGPGL
jgi:hypothetical protein